MVKKKDNTIIIIVSIIAIALFLVNVKPFNIAIGAINDATPSLISQDTISATYSFNFNSDAGDSGDCSTSLSEPFDFTIITQPSSQSAVPNFVEGLQQNVFFESSSVSISGIGATAGKCSGNERGATVIFDSKNAECKIVKLGPTNNDADVTCRFFGTVHAEENGNPISASFSRISGGSATTRFLKEGIECLSGEKCEGFNFFQCQNNVFVNQGEVVGECGVEEECQTNSDCPNDFQCSSNECIALQRANYYRFLDNECSLVSLLPSEVTDLDFATLELCEENKGGFNFTIVGIVLIGGLVVFSVFKFNLLGKRRRK